MNIASLEIKLIDMLKTNKATIPIYRKLKTIQNKKRFTVNSINTFVPQYDNSIDVRYNLILPSLRSTRVFAGIASALTFFFRLTDNNTKCRIIVIGNEKYNPNTTYQVKGYEHSINSQKQLVFVSENRNLNVGINDIFVLTSWKTAISFLPVFYWQKQEFHIKERKAVYLIQDFEPGFFPWSSEYVLAESTYSNYSEDIIAVFNSLQLYSFFKNRNYRFEESYYFRPMLNPSLKNKIFQETDKNLSKRKKRILIYGRPSEARNAFEIIRYSLELWSTKYEKSKDWEIISLGEGFSNIELKNNIIISRGKVTLDEYAEFMLSSYAGISLMISPHPSYPPLEMSTFGVRTITNKFEGKDLESFNKNIISINNCSPVLISDTLIRICEEYENYESCLQISKDYVEGDSLGETIDEVKSKLMEFIKE